MVDIVYSPLHHEWLPFFFSMVVLWFIFVQDDVLYFPSSLFLVLALAFSRLSPLSAACLAAEIRKYVQHAGARATDYLLSVSHLSVRRPYHLSCSYYTDETIFVLTACTSGVLSPKDSFPYAHVSIPHLAAQFRLFLPNTR